jgi:TPR repeat protein
MHPHRSVRCRSVATPNQGPMAARFLVASLIVVLLAMLVRPQSATAGLTPITATRAMGISHRGESATLDQHFAAAMATFQKGDVERALRAWRDLADQGHAGALYNLGVAYAQGVGVEPSTPEAIYWWHRAALAGSTEAQYNLGVAYAQGHNVEKSPAVASMWWYMAASNGDAAAQFNLGLMAAEGDGLRRDFENAMFWWQQAAAQGFPHAIQALDILERQGFIARPRTE